jgi:vitamin K-dependent gamma-carboxylase
LTLKISKFLFKPIDASVVSAYRIIFGLFMIYQMIYYFNLNYTYQFITGPELLFHYSELSFLPVLSAGLLKAIHITLLLAAVCITLGFLYRYAMVLYFLGFSYFSFIDKTLYNNHLYLIALIAFVMIFIKADRKFSVRQWISGNDSRTEIPAWNQYILIFIISLPYFFGGIAKLSPNWLNTELPQIIIDQSQGSFLHGILPNSILVPFITYGGLVYDLGVVFLLLYKRTRILAVLLVVLFNITNNSVLFNDIGIFPFFMVCSVILFFDAEKVNRFIQYFIQKRKRSKPKQRAKKKRQPKRSRAEQKAILAEQLKVQKTEDNTEAVKPAYTWTNHKRITVIALALFVLLQLILPIRYILYTDNPEWTGIANRFAWRMKMQHREITNFTMTFTDRNSGEFGPIDVNAFLSVNQRIHFAEDPNNIIVLTKYLHEEIEKKLQMNDPLIKADLQVAFNGLPSQYMFSPQLDLVRIDDSFRTRETWIFPLKEN